MQRLQQQGQEETPIRFWPHPKQREFLLDRYLVKYRALFGGGGSGKTLCGVYECLGWMLQNPGVTGAVFEPNYPMVKRNLFPILVKLLGYPVESNPILKEFNKSDLYLETKKGSRLWFISLDDPEHAEGQTLDFAHIDESRIIYDYPTAKAVVKRRLRGTIQKERIGLWETTTPPFGFDNELYRFYESPARDPESKVYRMSVMDNATNLPKGYIDDMIRTHTGGMREIFIYGRFADVGTGTFAFDSTKHLFSRDIPGTHYAQVRYGLDFGWSNPSAALAVGIDGDGRAFVLEEYYQARTNTEDLISVLREMLGKWGDGPICCDRSRPDTIDEIRRAGLPASADESKREDGIQKLGSRFADAGDGRPRLYVHARCPNLVLELQTYDPDRKENDHAIDALRYALAGLPGAPKPGYDDQPFI